MMFALVLESLVSSAWRAWRAAALTVEVARKTGMMVLYIMVVVWLIVSCVDEYKNKILGGYSLEGFWGLMGE
jgi:hypothetical protein